MGNTTTSAPPWTQALWAEAVLEIIQAKTGKEVDTPNNVSNLEHWMPAENHSATWWQGNDPLNVRNSSGQFSEPSLAGGALATANVILQPNMSMIAQALYSNSSLDTFSAAVVASPWDEGHYGGDPTRISGSTAVADTQAPSSTGSSFDLGNIISNIGSPSLVQDWKSGLGQEATAVGNAASSAVSDLSSVEKIAATIGGDLTSAAWWKRIGEFTLGLVLIVGGLLVFLSDTKAGHDATRVAEVAAVA